MNRLFRNSEFFLRNYLIYFVKMLFLQVKCLYLNELTDLGKYFQGSLIIKPTININMISTTDLHPMIVHFPIALIIVGFLAEVVSLIFKSEKCLSKTGFYLMILGTLAAIVAWTTGQLFTVHPSEGEIAGIFEKHETGALITMILMIIGSTFRIWLVIQKKEETQLKWIAFGLYLLAFASVSFTGFMGGTMVYNFMLGV
jgi:uncharacterized membrane protein